jgi:hypothetical protein
VKDEPCRWRCAICGQVFTAWAPAERHGRAGHHRLEAMTQNAEKVRHRHVWVPGDDGCRRGEVCVYCGKWRDAHIDSSETS